MKSATLGTFWHDSNASGSSFTRVRCIGNGSQVETHSYGAWKKSRANSVPDASYGKRFLRFRRKTNPAIDPPAIIGSSINTCGDNSSKGSSTTTLPDEIDGKSQQMKSMFSGQMGMYSSSVEIEIEMPATSKESEPRHLVCTLDTEQKEGSESSSEDVSSSGKGDLRSSPNQNRSRTNSVDMVMARNKIHSFSSNQSCQGCSLGFETADRVVVFESDPYHVECFTCGECSKLVDASANFLVLEEGSPLCTDCSPSCHVCSKKIVCGHVNVLNKDFHEDCLKCSVCKKVSVPSGKVLIVTSVEVIVDYYLGLRVHKSVCRINNDIMYSFPHSCGGRGVEGC